MKRSQLRPGDNIAYTKAGRPRLWREKISDETEPLEEYATQIGWVLLDWNILHASLFRLFWALVDDPKSNHLFANALWHSATSEDSQRKMLLAAAANKLKERHAAHNAIRWTIATIEKNF